MRHASGRGALSRLKLQLATAAFPGSCWVAAGGEQSLGHRNRLSQSGLSPDGLLSKRPQSLFRPGSLGTRDHGGRGRTGSECVLLSRYGCCPDGVSAAEGPQQAGCPRSHGGDNTGNRPGSRAVASKVSGSWREHGSALPGSLQLQPCEREEPTSRPFKEQGFRGGLGGVLCLCLTAVPLPFPVFLPLGKLPTENRIYS